MGTVENPVDASIFKTNAGTLFIEVAPRSADYFLPQRMTAPRVTNEVDGDFTLEATIAPTPRKDWSSAELPLAAGPDFFFRIGLSATAGDKPNFTCYYADRGKLSGIPAFEAPRNLTKPIRIRLQRRGRFVTGAHQQEGGAWTEFYPLNLQYWPVKIQVGVVALNTSWEPFTAEFSDFKLSR